MSRPAVRQSSPVRGDRKGAVRIADIPPAVLRGLNAGEIETKTLAEGLAMDFATLMRKIFPGAAAPALNHLRAERRITRRMALAGEILLASGGLRGVQRLMSHSSDTVRGWAGYALAGVPGMSLAERIEQFRPLADDRHFGVREWAWMALRPHLAENIEAAIRLLTPWTREASANLRRFGVESTRPRGVWCTHIQALKKGPELGLPLLKPLRDDPAKYVQDSVSNWLNDAAKSNPSWVGRLCGSWKKDSPCSQTRRICDRAMRSLRP